MLSLATVPVKALAPPTKVLKGVLSRPSPFAPGELSTNQINPLMLIVTVAVSVSPVPLPSV